MINDETCIFIISYKRAENILTYKYLKEHNYSGKIYIVVADDDEQLYKYKKIYKDMVITFNRKEIKPIFDICDNQDGLIGSVFPRNAINDIAKKLNIKYYLVLDDDYSNFYFRRCFGNTLKSFKINNFESIVDKCFDYLKNTTKIDCFSFAQNGDFIGGTGNFSVIGGKRKIMNAFFIKTEKPVKYIGRLNEDVNTYLYYGARGELYFTINDVSVQQLESQKVSGGMTELYNDSGTYLKSFYSVIVAPNAVKVSSMGPNDPRIHHKIKWKNAVPKLIREEFKK